MGWQSGNVQMHIWPLEHCLDPIDRFNYGPHVTAVCNAEGWTARMAFSMHYDHVYVYDIASRGARPKKAVVERLLNEVHQKRSECRALWWQNTGKACLDRATVVKLPNGTVDLLDNASPQQGIRGSIVAGSARYLPAQGVSIQVQWSGTQNSTTELLPEV
jgi:hypothetical protein